MVDSSPGPGPRLAPAAAEAPEKEPEDGVTAVMTLPFWPSVAGPGQTSSAALGATSAATLAQRSAGDGGLPRLCHELGRGAPCLRCGPVCPGFDLHYWR